MACLIYVGINGRCTMSHSGLELWTEQVEGLRLPEDWRLESMASVAVLTWAIQQFLLAQRRKNSLEM
jgi:hypothetical protein